MEAFFSRLRGKPYEYRRALALGVAVTVTCVIFFFWFLSTKDRLERHLESAVQQSATSTISGVGAVSSVEVVSPLEVISRTFFDGLNTIQTQFEELSKIAK